MIKEYVFNYNFNKAEACFRVDTEKFTKEHALATLNFFTWDYDREADPIDEVMKKYAIEAIQQATWNSYNTYGVKEQFNELEGFCKVDGSMGLELTHVECFEFSEDDMECTINCRNK